MERIRQISFLDIVLNTVLFMLYLTTIVRRDNDVEGKLHSLYYNYSYNRAVCTSKEVYFDML